MAKVRVTIDIGFAACGNEEIVDVGDMTPTEIDNMAQNMAVEWATSWEGDERLQDEWDEDSTGMFYEGVDGSWEWVDEDEEI